MFKDKFNTQKLNLYLKVSTRGFVLLQVNDRRYERNIIDMISAMRVTVVFDLKETDFRKGIEYLKVNKDVQILLYHGLDLYNETLKHVLEKINLSRDVLLAQERIVIFIVPRYVAFLIQDEFPNLYSYFSLKETYIKEYPVLFEYIFPDKKYLVTKDSQSEFKKFFYANEEGVEERLDYYMQKKVKERDVIRLKKDFKEYLETFHLHMQEYDWRYYYTLLLRMARVCVVQGYYEDAIEMYDQIVMAPIVLSSYQGIYYEAWIQKADVYFEQKDYKTAIELYKDIIYMVAQRHDYEDKDGFLEYVVKICSRLALCDAIVKDYDSAHFLMEGALKRAKQRNDETESFSLTYNQIVLALCAGNIEDVVIGSKFVDLKGLISCELQEALYLSLYAWYRGVIGGHCRHALKYAYEALVLKRKNFFENDVRIAESHYLISILHLLDDDTEHALECKRKCINILHNYELEQEKANLIESVFLDEK